MLARHREWIAGMGEVPVARDPKDLPQLTLENEQSTIDHMIRRGLFVPVTARELALVERRGAQATPPDVVNSKLYRALRFAERVFFVVMLVALALEWAAPRRGPRPIEEALFRLALLGGSLAALCLIKIVQYALKRPYRTGD
jgi:hypothetical protein